MDMILLLAVILILIIQFRILVSLSRINKFMKSNKGEEAPETLERQSFKKREYKHLEYHGDIDLDSLSDVELQNLLKKKYAEYREAENSRENIIKKIARLENTKGKII